MNNPDLNFSLLIPDSFRASEYRQLPAEVPPRRRWTIWDYCYMSWNIHKKLCWLLSYHLHPRYWGQVILTYSHYFLLCTIMFCLHGILLAINKLIFLVYRHLDNLLLRDDGRLFHVDFGFILGRDPKPFPPPMKLCKEMVEAMGGAERYYSPNLWLKNLFSFIFLLTFQKVFFHTFLSSFAANIIQGSNHTVVKHTTSSVNPVT